jgi:prophage regulatory protein
MIFFVNAKEIQMVTRAIRRDELRSIVPLSDTTIYQMESQGKFPRRFAITPRCVVWDYDEVIAWVRDRKSEMATVDTKYPPDVRKRKTNPVRARS